jgi:1,4-alpha-glucan branching enzyme
MPASDREGMGAVPFPDGTSFRVWAPHAQDVAVAGEFNGWSTDADPLTAEGDGYWSAFCSAAHPPDQYKYFLHNGEIDLNLWKNDPYARQMTNSAGNSIIAEPDPNPDKGQFRPAPWNELVIYELHVGTFTSDPDGPNGRGTFRSTIFKLDDIRDLGFNAIQLMASAEFPTDVSWGYNPANIFAIESSYGGPNGFRELVDAAHVRGLAVIMDVVYNHLSNTDLDLWQFDGWNIDGHGGIYFYQDDRRFTRWGDNRPDYGRLEVRQFLRDNALRWLDQRRCDGLRWDATGEIRSVDGSDDPGALQLADGWSLMRQINRAINDRWPWKLSIAEDMQQNDAIVHADGAGFDTQWDAAFVHPVRRALTAALDEWRNMFDVRAAIEKRYGSDAFARVVYTESHDEVATSSGNARLSVAISPGNGSGYHALKRSTLGAALLFTVPGIPMIFQGQEFASCQGFSDALLEWTPGAGDIVGLYRDLAHLRRNWFDNTRGLRGQGLYILPPNDGAKVMAFQRWDEHGPGDDVLVVLNFSALPFDSYRLGFPDRGLWRLRFNSDWTGYSSSFGGHISADVIAEGPPMDGLQTSAEISMGAYTALIFSR